MGLLVGSTLAFAQSTNGITTLIQDTLTSGGGKVGGGNPMSIATVVGEPLGGRSANVDFTVRIGYQPATLTLPAGTRTIAVEGSIDDPTASVSVNSLPATITGSTFRAEGIPLIEGLNVMSATATDVAGNRSTTSITVTLDTQPPARPTVAITPEVTTANSYTLTGTKIPGSSIWMNGVQVVALNDQTSWTAVMTLVEGDNEFAITAKDAAGNLSTAARIIIVVDNLPPVISNLTYRDPEGTSLRLDPTTSQPKTNFPQVTIAGQVDDHLTQVRINGVTAKRTGRTFQADVPLNPGPNTLKLVATSPLEHVTTQTLQVILGYLPTVASLMPPDGTKAYVGDSTTFSITATDVDNDPLDYQLLRDGAILVDWTSGASHPWIPTIADLGPHAFEARVRDGFGGFAPKSAEVYVLRKPLPPP